MYNVTYVPSPDRITPLTKLLRDTISSRGPIPFREFMAQALYHPAHGYYESGRAAIGRHGDFITSVSVGRLFGTLLARQFEEMWERLGRPGKFSLIEQGAHDGTLMEDVLLALKENAPDCLSSAQPVIIEPAEGWREKQRERLAAWPVQWVDSVDSLDPFTGIHFSNELLDAFPVHLVRRRADGWAELYVDWDGDRLILVDKVVSGSELQRRADRLDVPVGYRTEFNLDATRWLRTLGQKLLRGFVLVIDYGFPQFEYYRPDRIEGTLEAVAGHRREKDILARPGELDLTAHVDFTDLAVVALSSGLSLEGFTDQHHFLVGLAPRHFPEGEQPSASDMRAFQTLAHPTMLGRSFKVFAAARDVLRGKLLAGFSQSKPAPELLGLTL